MYGNLLVTIYDFGLLPNLYPFKPIGQPIYLLWPAISTTELLS